MDCLCTHWDVFLMWQSRWIKLLVEWHIDTWTNSWYIWRFLIELWFYDLNGFVSTGDGVDIGVILNNIFPSLYQTHKEPRCLEKLWCARSMRSNKPHHKTSICLRQRKPGEGASSRSSLSPSSLPVSSADSSPWSCAASVRVSSSILRAQGSSTIAVNRCTLFFWASPSTSIISTAQKVIWQLV